MNARYPRLKVGYSSHGEWSPLSEIRKIERERGNTFPRLSCPSSTPAIWVCKTPRKAARYAALAEDWDFLNSGKPLTPELKEIVKDMSRVPLKKTDRIVFDDGDEGYLVVRGCSSSIHTLRKRAR